MENSKQHEEELKQATAERVKAEETDRLYGSAVHEAAHVIFGLHFDIPIGEKGVCLRRFVFGTNFGHDLAEYSGFSDSLFSQWAGTSKIKEMNEYQRIVFGASGACGPFAEYQWHASAAGIRGDAKVSQERIEEIIRGGAFDFIAPNVGNLCFLLYFGCSADDPAFETTDASVLAYYQSVVALAREFLETYFTKIVEFADILSRADGLRLSCSQVEAWATEHFAKQAFDQQSATYNVQRGQ